MLKIKKFYQREVVCVFKVVNDFREQFKEHSSVSAVFGVGVII